MRFTYTTVEPGSPDGRPAIMVHLQGEYLGVVRDDGPKGWRAYRRVDGTGPGGASNLKSQLAAARWLQRNQPPLAAGDRHPLCVAALQADAEYTGTIVCAWPGHTRWTLKGDMAAHPAVAAALAAKVAADEAWAAHQRATR